MFFAGAVGAMVQISCKLNIGFRLIKINYNYIYHIILIIYVSRMRSEGFPCVVGVWGWRQSL